MSIKKGRRAFSYRASGPTRDAGRYCMAVRITHDPEADAVYVVLRDVTVAHTEELDSDRIVDYGADGQPRGIELLNVSMGVDLDGMPERDRVPVGLPGHSQDENRRVEVRSAVDWRRVLAPVRQPQRRHPPRNPRWP